MRNARSLADAARLLDENTERQGECIVWTGHINDVNGYGRTVVDGQRIYTHRLAYELINGPIAEGHVVLHRCDNPPCCNPAHLLEGTQSDNCVDMWLKGRGTNPPVHLGEAAHSAKLCEADVREVRRLISAGFNDTEIGRRFDVAKSTIRMIRIGRNWKHVT